MIRKRYIDEKKLINKKFDNDYIFVYKNKICAKIYLKILIMFYYVTLIIANEKFQLKSQLNCENLKYLLILFLL